MRFRCWLLGCDYKMHGRWSVCGRCRAYSNYATDQGYTVYFGSVWFRWRCNADRAVWRVVHRCPICRRLIWFGVAPYCSHSCERAALDELPF